MRHGTGLLLFSATDLSRHLACSHLTSLRRAVAFGELEPPPPYDDTRAEVLSQRGIEHETASPRAVRHGRAHRRDGHPIRHAVLAPGPAAGHHAHAGSDAARG